MAKSEKEIEWERKQLILHYAADTRKFEIQLFWQRSLYFWGLVAASLVAYATLHTKYEPGQSHALCVLMVCFGFLTSIAWALQSLGGKYWHEAWEQKLYRAEKATLHTDDKLFEKDDRHHLFGGIDEVIKPNPSLLKAERYSVSKLAIIMSYLAVILWFCLAILESNLALLSSGLCKVAADWSILGPYLITIILALLIGKFGKSQKS
jgi:hypothetical protein